MDPLTLPQLLLALAVNHGHPGRSPYSAELMPECGRDKKQPTCAIAPLCPEPAPQCRRPRFSRARRAWVRMERKETAEKRFAGIAKALNKTAKKLTSCKEDDPRCEPIDWPGTTKSLALATLAVALHESGLREDVQFGHPPLGRGPQGEACLVQVALSQAPRYASWLPETERQRIADSRSRREKLAKSLLGDSPKSLSRCFEVGMRMLARSRAACGRAGVPWAFGMFSMYGGGKSCNVPPIGKTRGKTFQRLTAARPKLDDRLKSLLR